MVYPEYIWFDGKFVKYKDATVHVQTHSLQYGTGIFDTMRAYNTTKGTAIFRLKDHVKRFINTARTYHMDLGLTAKQLEDAIVDTVQKNTMKSAYIKLFGFYNDQRVGLTTIDKKVSISITLIDLGNYYENKDKGIRCKVSSWRRINSEILPPGAKGSGNYLNAMLATMDARRAGYEEAIMLGLDGHVTEGATENVFLARDGRLITPGPESDILMGVTRDSIIKIAENIGLTVEEREVHREELYSADEIFFTGTAAELTSVIEIDDMKVGNGKTGPITKMMQDRYSKIIMGEDKEFIHWLTFTKG